MTFDTREDAEAWLSSERRLVSSMPWTSPSSRKAAERAEAAKNDIGSTPHGGEHSHPERGQPDPSRRGPKAGSIRAFFVHRIEEVAPSDRSEDFPQHHRKGPISAMWSLRDHAVFAASRQRGTVRMTGCD